MNKAIRQLVRGAVLRVLDDINVTSSAERDRILARAQDEAERSLRLTPHAGLERVPHDEAMAIVTSCIGRREFHRSNIEPEGWELLYRCIDAAFLRGVLARQQWASITVEVKGEDIRKSLLDRLQQSVDGLAAESVGKSEDWKAGVLALVAALQAQ